MRPSGFQKRLTIILIPDDGTPTRHFTVHAVFMPILAVLLFLGGFSMYCFLSDYHKLEIRQAKAFQMQRENAVQRRQLVLLAKRIDQIDRSIEELNHPLREVPFGENGQKDHIHRPPLELAVRIQKNSQAEFSSAREAKGLIQPMLLALNILNQDIMVLEKERMKKARFSANQLRGNVGLSQTKRPGLGEPEEKIREILKEVAAEMRLEPRLALSMAKVESGFNTEVVSPKGAIGILQVTPRLAWHHYGIPKEMLFHPETNIRVGLSVMKSLLERFNQNIDLALAAYNAGTSRVLRAGNKVPAIRETQAYVTKVKAAMAEF